MIKFLQKGWLLKKFIRQEIDSFAGYRFWSWAVPVWEGLLTLYACYKCKAGPLCKMCWQDDVSQKAPGAEFILISPENSEQWVGSGATKEAACGPALREFRGHWSLNANTKKALFKTWIDEHCRLSDHIRTQGSVCSHLCILPCEGVQAEDLWMPNSSTIQ